MAVRPVGVAGVSMTMVAAAIFMGGCGAAGANDSGRPDALTPTTDVGSELPTDLPDDVGSDPPRDVPTETAPDVPTDVGADAGADTDTGSPPDGGAPDAPRDVPPMDTSPPPDGSGGDAQPSSLDGPGIFVGVGYGGRRVRSLDDGMTWIDDVSITANGGDDNNLLRTVAWGGGQFVALGFRVITSPNGKDWHDYGTTIGQWIGAAVYAQGQYVGVGGYGLRGTSADGVTWVHHDIDTIASHSDTGHGLIFSNDRGGRYISANDDGRRSSSTDGKTWMFSTGASTTRTTDLAFGNGVYVAVGGTGVALSSDGGLTWSEAAQVASAATSVVFAQGHFTATGSGHVFTSADGTSWTDHPVAGLASGGLAYGHGTYINISGVRLRRSTDGIVWAPAVVLSGTNGITTVVFGPTG